MKWACEYCDYKLEKKNKLGFASSKANHLRIKHNMNYQAYIISEKKKEMNKE